MTFASYLQLYDGHVIKLLYAALTLVRISRQMFTNSAMYVRRYILLYTEKSLQESCAVAKMTARCALYMGALNFRDSLTTPTATIPNIFIVFLFRSTLQNLKSVALPVPEIIGDTQKNGQSLDTPTLPFLQHF